MNGPTHTVGSHSDDRGGESDWPCYCDQNVAPSNSKSEDTPRMIDVHRKQLRAQRWLQDNTHEGITSEPPQDSPLGQVTSLDEPKACLCCNHVLAPLTNGLCFGCKEYLQTQQANLLQVIEDEVILVQCKECEGAHFFKAVPLEALKKIKESLDESLR